jgi:outer membrane protein TolC
VQQAADARYRSGMGTQQDLLQAQLQQTKLLREIAMHHLEVGKFEAQIKQLLNRPQDSPDIEPAELVETPLVQTYAEVLAAAEVQNPEIASAKRMIENQSLQVDLAHRDFYPDFNVQYMWQRTDPTQFRAYYMLSVGVRVPIYRSRKQRPELAQAEAEKLRAGSELQAQSQQIAAELRGQYVLAQQTSELLKIHREGSPLSRGRNFKPPWPPINRTNRIFKLYWLRFSTCSTSTKSTGRTSPNTRPRLRGSNRSRDCRFARKGK